MRKKRIIVIMGGPSKEHEVSLNTGKQIIQSLDGNKYLAVPVVISKTGKWLLPAFTNRLLSANNSKPIILSESQVLKKVGQTRPDAVFIAMHGEYGEDGKIQGLLDTIGVPYTGSGVLASALGMDKVRSASLFRGAGLLVPDFMELVKNEIPREKIIKKFGFPLVTKPSDRGSSVGVSIVKSQKDLKKAISYAKKFSKRIMAQKYVNGREITCGVLEKNGKLIALPPVEIKPKADKFYDYNSKYSEGGSEHIIPPKNISKSLLNMIKSQAVLAHRIIGCSGMSRSDFILGEDGNLYILEINTIPGMTKTSLLPESARALGIKFPRLLDCIIISALEKFRDL